MGLRKYLAKRHFNNTPEPKGSDNAREASHNKVSANRLKHPRAKLKFVVQEHHASQLHYDFRLELDGVLKSWAVPKGPSMNPHDHHLAIQVEDHPYDYRNFEGVIPEGNYGAGDVIIWDEGTYEPRQDYTAKDDIQKIIRTGLAKGHLTFIMHGTKLQGEFALIKMPHANEKNAWLLIKKGDTFATTADILQQDTSVKSGRKVDDLGAYNKIPDLSHYPKQPAPQHVKPMLCTLVEQPFDDPDWVFEIKWDGYRAIASHTSRGNTLYSRNDVDFAERFPPVFEALHDLKHEVVLDGEIIVIDSEGQARFEWLQQWHKDPRGQLLYQVFDILWCDGHDLRQLPLTERKKILRAILPAKSLLQFSDDLATEGTVLFTEMRRKGLEGIVAKRATSSYQDNVRGSDWLKIKTHMRQEVVIGGFTEPRGSRTYLGSLLVGVYRQGELVFVGHSGGGIPDKDRKQLRSRLEKLERTSSPFSNTPKPNAPVHWVKPELVCEMNFTEWTADGSMRHPKFIGLRVDKKPRDVHRERARSLGSENLNKQTANAPRNRSTNSTQLLKAHASTPHFDLTHLDKVFFPKHKYTKGDLVDYYESVAGYILPYLKDRALSLLRQPGGVNDHGFFQKNVPNAPDWLTTADIFSESHGGNMHWIVGNSLEALLYAVQLGSIEINPWSSRVGQLDKPDWAVIDLDPEDVTFQDVVAVAKTVKVVCDEWQIPCYPKTSGKTGIHIFIPTGAQYSYEQVKNMAHLLALEVNRRQPALTSVERMPDKRKHRIYLDFLQNRQGQTLAAPYSVRPTPDANVSTPLHWDEVVPSLKPSDFTINNALRRFKHVGDLWKPVMGAGVDLAKVIEHAERHYADK